jgi:4-hydroxybenzoate polyprenyltransferase
MASRAREGAGRATNKDSGSFLGKLGDLGSAVIFRHTLFSLPFALAAVLLETGGRPPLLKLLFILVAAVAGRNLANALNRLIDREIDARNPRTAGRHLPTGRLSTRDLWLFAAAMGALLLAATLALGWLCLALLPIAAIAIFGYSFTKRYTWLCHFWLGASCALAPMGSLIALSGRVFELRFFAISSAVAFWVGGFDILYAIQDIEVDRREGLKSVPARFGEDWARLAAAASHLAAVVCFGSLPFFWPLGSGYWAGLILAILLLMAEHLVALGRTEGHVRIAAYGINEIIPLVMLAAVALDLFVL